MKPRRQPNLTEQVAILIRQAACGCGCGEPLGDRPEYHHQHERALGGADHVDNWIALRPACHGRITNGTKATRAGSSKSRIAKANRLEKARLALAYVEGRVSADPDWIARQTYEPVVRVKIAPWPDNLAFPKPQKRPKSRLQGRPFNQRKAKP
jgi:hypothetical protein